MRNGPLSEDEIEKLTNILRLLIGDASEGEIAGYSLLAYKLNRVPDPAFKRGLVKAIKILTKEGRSYMRCGNFIQCTG